MYQLPRAVGPLTIERRQGSDGVVDTYRGIWHSQDGQPVVVRRFKDWVVANPALLSKVESRVADLRALRNPRLVGVLDYIHTGKGASRERLLVEEAPDGVDLMHITVEVARAGESLSPRLVQHIALELCAALEALHSLRGSASGEDPMLHRAVRPGAAFLTVDGSVQLGGFGLLPRPDFGPQPPLRDVVREYAAYLAPEQVEPARSVGRAADVFSVGCVIYTLATGKVLFDATNDLLSTIQKRQPDLDPALDEVKSTFPGLERVLRSCLFAVPERRYQSVTRLADDLRQLRPPTRRVSHGATPSHDDDDLSSDLTDLWLLLGFAPTATSTGAVVEPVPAIEQRRASNTWQDPVWRETSVEDNHRSAPWEKRFDSFEGHSVRATEEEDDEPTAHDADAIDERRDEPTATDPEFTRRGPALDLPPPLYTGSYDDDEMDELGASEFGPLDEEDDAFTESSYVPENKPLRPPVANDPSFGHTLISMTSSHTQTPTHGPRREPVIERTARSSAMRNPESTQRSDAIRGTEAPPTWVSPTPVPGRPARPGPYDGFDHGSGPHTPTEAQIFPPTDVSEMGELPFLRFAQLGAVVVMIAFLGGLIVFRTVLGPEEEPAIASAEPDPLAAAAPPTHVLSALQPPLPDHAAPAAPTAMPAEAPLQGGAIAQAPATPPTGAPPGKGALPASNALDLSAGNAAPAIPAADLPPHQPALTGAAPPAAWAPPVRLVDTSIGERAAKGRLSGSDRATLEAIDTTHPDYTRARVWLYDDATARRALPDRKRYIDQLMRLPENATNPVYLLDAADVALALEDWSTALSLSRKAEQHWSRLPSAAAFNRKAMMYEQQATAWYGLFVRSGNKDAEDLDQSLRAWQKYRDHVSSRDAGLAARADAQIARLSGLGPKVQ